MALIHGMAEGINRKLRRLISSLKDRQAYSLCLKGRRPAPQGAPRRSSSPPQAGAPQGAKHRSSSPPQADAPYTLIPLNLLRIGSIVSRRSGGAIKTFRGRLAIRPLPVQCSKPTA